MKTGGAARISVFTLIFALGFAGLAARTAQIALFTDVPGESVSRIAVAADPDAPRGDLTDRNGEILARSLDVWSIYADPARVVDPEATARALAGALDDFDIASATRRLSARDRRFVWLRRGVTPRDREAVFSLGLPGIDFRAEPRRVYPRGALAAHVLGHVNIDGVGAAGAERAFDENLTSGAGEALALSIDMRVQFALDETLRAAVARYRADGGVAIVSDIETGEILALVSLPDFDPNRVGDYPLSVRRNRALVDRFELGSIFKTFTIAAALDVGLATPNSVLPTSRGARAGDRLITDHGAGGDLTVAQIFVRSSNTGAALLALEMGETLQRSYFERLGLLNAAPVGFLESAAPIVPDSWDANTRATMAFGHGVSVSPVAFVAAFGAIVNGGEYVPPTLRRVEGGANAVSRTRVISRETSAAMVGLLRLAVERGTGRRADVPGYGVAGKTGTAERPIPGGYDPDSLISSFAAVFPYDAPRYALLVTLDGPLGAEEENGRASAGYTAAPTAAAVIARIAPLLGVARRDDPLMAVLREADP